MIVALPVACGVMSAVAFAAKSRQRSWRFIAVGSLLWTAEEGIWALVRLGVMPQTVLLTDILYIAGSLLWLVGLVTLRPRRLPRANLLWFSPVFILLGWLLLQHPLRALTLYFPVLEVLLFIAMLPALEATFQNEAPIGRLLWGFGLFVRTLAAALFVWLAPELPTGLGYFLLVVLAYSFMAMGMWLENNGKGQGILSVAYSVIAVEVVIGVTLLMIYTAQVAPTLTLAMIGVVLGYTLFLGIMVHIINDRRQRRRAEQDIKRHSALLERLVAFTPDEQLSIHPAELLNEFLLIVQSFFPEVQGVVYREADNTSAGSTRGYTYPLVTNGTNIGHLVMQRAPEDTRGLDAAMPLLAARMQSVFAHAEVQSLAQTDPLTGLLNRRGMQSKVALLLHRISQKSHHLTAVMIDIDHFKRVNDRFGHGVGDIALQALALVLRRNTRSDDLLIRWGGEEFLILLDDANLVTAKSIVRRVQRDFAAETIPEIPWPLTISAGIAVAPVSDASFSLTSVINAADRALLKAKREGRNRFEIGVPTKF